MEKLKTDQRDTGLRKVLTLSWAYEGFQRLVGSTASYDLLARDYIRPSPGHRVLDIGCGTAEISKWLPDANYDGFDPNPRYVAAAHAHLSGQSRVWEGSIDAPSLDADGYDLVLGMGVLHHVNDILADRFFALASEVVTGAGRVITADPCRYHGQSRSARFMVNRDRGTWVREPKDYQSLANRYFHHVTVTVREDLLKIPYSHAILEASGIRRLPAVDGYPSSMARDPDPADSTRRSSK